MATENGLAKVAALLKKLGPPNGEPLGPEPPWKPSDPLVEKLFENEIIGSVENRKRKLSDEYDYDIMDELEENHMLSDQVKDSFEDCQDLASAYTALRGGKPPEARTPVTASAVINVLGLLISCPELSLEAASYFLVNKLGPHLTSENVDQLEGALQRYPSLTEPLLAQLAVSEHTLAAQLLTRMQALIQPHTLRRVLVAWLLQEPLTSTSPAFLQVCADADPDVLQNTEVAEVLAAAVTRAPVESDSCLKLSKWLAGCLPVLTTYCSEERRSQLQQRLRSNKTFLKSKLLRLIEK